jgi:hypothetical protein
MILIRYILIGLIVYLLVRAFTKYSNGDNDSSSQGGGGRVDKPEVKKVSKEIGEYIDYEEIKKL